MLESISEKIQLAFKHLKGSASITELNVASVTKDIRKALLDADVQYKIAKDFTEKVRKRAIGEKVVGALRPDQVMVRIMRDELTELLGGEHETLSWKGAPCVVMVAGLQGVGKTTFCAKLANMLAKKHGLRPMLIAADVYRPAAITQLKVLAESVGVAAFAGEENDKDVIKIVQAGLAQAKADKNNVVIIDTAGRLSIDERMMSEVEDIKRTAKPTHTLFVVDAMMGQDAVNVAEVFDKRLDITGVVLTKMDGDTRGGAAMSVKYTTGKPIVLVGTGEKMDDLQEFYPDRLAERILGMGDIASLVEKAESIYDEEQAKKLEKKIRKNKFDLDDFMRQLAMIKKMGSFKDVLSMVPGMSGQLKNIPEGDQHFVGIEAMIKSMTPAERENPDMLNASRKDRVARGSGRSVQELNRFLQQFNQMKKMMRDMNAGGGMGANMSAMMNNKFPNIKH